MPRMVRKIRQDVSVLPEFIYDETLDRAVAISASNQLPVSIDAGGHVLTNNSSTTPLDAGATFTGQSEEILEEAILFVNAYSDVASATDGLSVEQSPDGVNWDSVDVYTIPAATGKTFSFQPAYRYFRVRYTNGAVAQSEFRLQVVAKHANSKPSSHRIQDQITTEDDAELVKSVITGQAPSGNFVNFGSTEAGNFKVAVQEYGDTPSIDPFDRLRVSNPYTLLDSKQLHDDQPLFWDEILGGSASSAHSSADADVVLTVTASASDYAMRQTKQRPNYQPGKGQLILMTFHCPQQTGVTARIGAFDGIGGTYMTPNNGVFLKIEEDQISWNIAKNGSVTQTVAQANWNYDVLDGNGNSSATLDLDATVIAIIDYEWLGVGRVRVGFVIDGIIRYCHYFNHANDPAFTSVYMSTPNLSLRYDIASDGTGGGTLDHICSSIMSEGGLEETGILRSINNGTTAVVCTTAGTSYALLGIRLKSAYKDITVYPEFASILATSADNFLWQLRLNPTVAGTFTYADVTDSAIQRAIGVSANTVTGGLIIDSGYGAARTDLNRKFVTALRIGSTIAGVMDTLVLSVTAFSNNANIVGSLTFRELL